MKEIVSKIGWPTISKVGKEASSGAWLLIQHADHDIDFQKECLSVMKSESGEEISLRNIAYLEDRIKINLGLPQVYGTQFKLVDGEFIPNEIEDPEHVEERRKKWDFPLLMKISILCIKLIKYKNQITHPKNNFKTKP